MCVSNYLCHKRNVCNIFNYFGTYKISINSNIGHKFKILTYTYVVLSTTKQIYLHMVLRVATVRHPTDVIPS